MILTNTTESVQVVTALSGAVDWYARYEDYSVSTGLTQFNSGTGSIAGATTTTVVPAPGSGVNRKVTFLSFFNNNATTQTVKVELVNSSTAYNIAQSDNLQQYYTFEYVDGVGFRLLTDGGFLANTGVNAGTVTSVGLSAPSFLSVSGSPVTTSGTLSLSYSGTALPVANGGTGATTASAAFNALSPITNTGDLLVGIGTNSAGNLPIGAANYVLTSNGTTVTWQSPGNTVSANSIGTNASFYPLIISGNTSGAYLVDVSSPFTMNPATGVLTATTFSGSGASLTNIPNGALVNSSITVTGGTGLGVSGSPVSLGGTVTLSNTGVTSIVAGTNISVSGATGAVTVNVSGTVASATTATTATTATNIASGSTNQIPYQTGSGTTSFYSAANYGVQTYTATGVPSSVAGAAGVLQGSASSIPTFTTTPTLTGTNFSAIPNSALTNSSLTVGTTSISLGSSSTTLAGLTSVTSNTYSSSVPTSFGTSTYTVLTTDTYVINNYTSGTATITLPTASSYSGRRLVLTNAAAQLLVSASSNVIALGTVGPTTTSILSASTGKWAELISNGSNWIIVAGN